MRLLHFLRERWLWFYSSTWICAASLLVFYIFIEPSPEKEIILYPLVENRELCSNILFCFCHLLLVSSVISAFLCFMKFQSTFKGAVLIASVLIISFVLLVPVRHFRLRHLESLTANHHVYKLAERPVGDNFYFATFPSGYIVYECEESGFLCRSIHTFYAESGLPPKLWIQGDKIVLGYDYHNTVVFEYPEN